MEADEEPMAKRVDAERTSELEQLVLGIIWKKGPCTSHAVRTEFAASRNLRFSGSAGAIYPLVARLEERGLIRAEEDRVGKQSRRLLEVTPEGLRALRQWLRPPFGEHDFAVQYDPIRTRTYFLGALTDRQRRQFVDEAEAGYRAQVRDLEATRERYRETGWHWSALATDGVIEHCRGQLRWLRAVRVALDGGELGRG